MKFIFVRLLVLSTVIYFSACGTGQQTNTGNVPDTGQAGIPPANQSDSTQTPIASSDSTKLETPALLSSSTPSSDRTKGQSTPNSAEEQGALAPVCTPPAAPTPPLTEGPYFKAGSPETRNLAYDLPGKHLVLSGYVYDTSCKPVSGTKLDFWQADSQGRYDNGGFTLRGHQLTDEKGRYSLETVVPGLYPGRTEHIHVKVAVPGFPELTTQLFFPGISENDRDRIYNNSLLIQVVSESADRVDATYTFIVDIE